MARRLYDSANKLDYVYAGPYRVEAVLDNGRYRLTDLENNHTVNPSSVTVRLVDDPHSGGGRRVVLSSPLAVFGRGWTA